VEGQEEKLRSQLDEVAHALLATETQRRSGLLVQRVEEVMARLKDVEGKLAGLQTEKGTMALERGSKDAKITQLEGKRPPKTGAPLRTLFPIAGVRVPTRSAETLGKGQEQRALLEEQITHLREELLARTRELKDLTLAHEALHRVRSWLRQTPPPPTHPTAIGRFMVGLLWQEQRQVLDRYARVEDVVGQKQEEIEVGERPNQPAGRTPRPASPTLQLLQC
jgi:DNA repair exonuclease SbcCD ATPase subunit